MFSNSFHEDITTLMINPNKDIIKIISFINIDTNEKKNIDTNVKNIILIQKNPVI